MDAKALRVRALALLAQREYSRAELRRKLLRLAQARSAESPQPGGEGGEGALNDPTQAEAVVDSVLEALGQAGWQSDQRATESRLRAGAARAGARKLAADLQQRGLSAEGEAWAQILATEAERARALLVKRFGSQPPADRDETARRVRFLLNRGFEPALAGRLSRLGADD